MWNNSIKIYFICVFCIACKISTFGNNDSLALPAKHIIVMDSSAITIREPEQAKQQELLSDKDYIYDRKEEPPKNFWQRFTSWLRSRLREILSSKGGEMSLSILQYLLIAAAIVLIVLLLLKNNIRSIFYGKSASVAAIDYSEFNDDIHSIDFNALIENAISQKDFRRAIRLHFLRLLKELSDKNLIAWKLDKTNNDYLIELSQTAYREHFRGLATIYEYIWYGNFVLSEKDFYKELEKFKAFTV